VQQQLEAARAQLQRDQLEEAARLAQEVLGYDNQPLEQLVENSALPPELARRPYELPETDEQAARQLLQNIEWVTDTNSIIDERLAKQPTKATYACLIDEMVRLAESLAVKTIPDTIIARFQTRLYRHAYQLASWLMEDLRQSITHLVARPGEDEHLYAVAGLFWQFCYCRAIPWPNQQLPTDKKSRLLDLTAQFCPVLSQETLAPAHLFLVAASSIWSAPNDGLQLPQWLLPAQVV